MSRAGYYAFLKSASRRFNRDQFSLELITKYFEKSRRKAGIITLDLMLRRDGIVINHKKIARLKRQYGILTKIRRKNPYKGLHSSVHEHSFIPNLLQRDFVRLQPDEAYSTDMTYLYYGNCEKAYLSATKDLGTNEIISYRLMKTPLVSHFVEEFKEMIDKVPMGKRKDLIIHSDQGYQYTHPSFIRLLKDANIRQSMSRKGNCLDNAPIESFFGHFKDLIELKKCKSFDEVEKEVTKTISYYNNERPQKGLNKKPPVEYRGLISLFI